MVDDMGMAEEAIDDALVESAGYDDDNTGDENTIIQLVNQNKELEASLDEAEALTRRNVELMNGYLTRIAELEVDLEQEEHNSEAFMNEIGKQACQMVDLETKISDLMSQVAALQKIAIGERAKLIEVGGESSRRPLLPGDQEDLDTLARDQLLRELPEAFR